MTSIFHQQTINVDRCQSRFFAWLTSAHHCFQLHPFWQLMLVIIIAISISIGNNYRWGRAWWSDIRNPHHISILQRPTVTAVIFQWSKVKIHCLVILTYPSFPLHSIWYFNVSKIFVRDVMSCLVTMLQPRESLRTLKYFQIIYSCVCRTSTMFVMNSGLLSLAI